MKAISKQRKIEFGKQIQNNIYKQCYTSETWIEQVKVRGLLYPKDKGHRIYEINI